MNHHRISIARASHQLPQTITILPYLAVKTFFRFILGKVDKDIWFRNSLALNYWRLGLSDVDLSIMAKDKSEAIKIAKKVRGMGLFTFGGEIQIYSRDSLDAFIEVGNCYEIMRDPILCETIKYSKTGSDYDKAVFIIKSLISDKGLVLYPDLRQEKWRKHFELIGVKMNFKASLDSIINHLFRYDFISQFFKEEDIQDFFLASSKESSVAYPFFFSNKIPWKAGSSEEFKVMLAAAPESLHQLINSFVCWEIWGLYPMTQLLYAKNFENILSHIDNQTHLIHNLKISDEKKEFIIKKLNDLKIYYSDVEM